MSTIIRKRRIPEPFLQGIRTRTFTLKEDVQIIDMPDDNEDMENQYLIDLAESRWDEENITFDEMMKLMEE